ncbi:hypothetical protein MYX07_00960 [Patescibacteria group bacterium AH-259-L07]|nr:hypothetical protein [Patescibacteria group bacterium AH-259-L07]
MAIKLLMRPNDPPMSWRKFCRVTEPYSIALDGYVSGKPRRQKSGPRISFNHHEKVDNLATRSTCMQVYAAIRDGFFTTLFDARDENNEPEADVLAGDCDEDVSASNTVLKHGHKKEFIGNPRLIQFVFMQDLHDTVPGIHPFPNDLSLFQQIAWIFEPYRYFRISGEIDKRDPETYKGIVKDIEKRILKHISGHGESIAINMAYEKIGGGPGWAMIQEIGAQAGMGVFRDGYHAYVSVRQRPDGRRVYAMHKKSFFYFPLPKFYKIMNKIEKLRIDRWGGGNNRGGSARVRGSGVPPDELMRIVNEKLNESQ